MDPGELNKRVTIQLRENNTPLNDEVYKDFRTVWAKISNIHGKEFIEAQKIQANISKKITIRYIRELDPSINDGSSENYIIKYKNVLYNILYIDNIQEKNLYMELMLEVI